MTTCSQCGTNNADEASFCGSFGSSLKDQAPAKEQPLKEPYQQPPIPKVDWISPATAKIRSATKPRIAIPIQLTTKT